MALEIRLFQAASDPDAWRRALAIRYAVFVEEQGVPLSEEIDFHDTEDPTCVHAMAIDRDEAAATGRLYEPSPNEGKIGRMAVLPAFRGRGTGRAILDVLIEEGRRRGLATLRLDAQLHAREFYVRRGFVAEGSTFLDAGLPHQAMRRALP
ncbi:MAG: GNAT family N-acetyltransferase [Candidatus Eremiobacteraeota bacterium]|nr:GNAT family N-acetyltransferase [Candidatus Eremiobacteraeota bacterium]